MKFRHAVFIFMFGIFFVHHIAFADIIINEIAWMGTTTSANDEWIELFNNGTSSVTIDGWTLKASDGSPSINLTGSISSGGYMLLERTDDNTVPNVTAGVIYSGAMSNTGENFSLKNNTEQVMDSVNMISGWPAGNATTKETMQRKGSGWITGTPTPSAVNVSNDSGTGNDNPNPDVDTTNTDEETKNKEVDIKTLIKPDPKYSSSMIIPDIIIQETPITFESAVKRDGFWNDLVGRFEWSMGDGSSFTFSKSTEFNYTYHAPGTYVVILHYYSDVFRVKPDAIHKKTITVIPASVSISINPTTGLITVTNHSTDELNIEHWNIQSENDSFIIPRDTVITKGGSLNIPFQVHKLMNWSRTPTISTPTGYIASHQMRSVLLNTSVTPTQAQIEQIEDSLFETATTKDVTTPVVEGNYKDMIWILLFLLLLIIANIAFILLGKKIEEIESVANRA